MGAGESLAHRWRLAARFRPVPSMGVEFEKCVRFDYSSPVIRGHVEWRHSTAWTPRRGMLPPDGVHWHHSTAWTPRHGIVPKNAPKRRHSTAWTPQHGMLPPDGVHWRHSTAWTPRHGMLPPGDVGWRHSTAWTPRHGIVPKNAPKRRHSTAWTPRHGIAPAHVESCRHSTAWSFGPANDEARGVQAPASATVFPRLRVSNACIAGTAHRIRIGKQPEVRIARVRAWRNGRPGAFSVA